MGLISYIKNRINNRKVLKLKMINNEKIELCVNTAKQQIEEITKSQKSKEEMLESIYKILEDNLTSAKQYSDDTIEMKDFVKYFDGTKEVKDSILFKNQQNDEISLVNNFSLFSNEEKYKAISQYIDKYCKDRSGIKIISKKEQYEIMKKLFEKYEKDEITLKHKLYLMDEMFETDVCKTILQSQNPYEVLKAYNEYIHDFLKDDLQLEEKFRQKFMGINDNRKVGNAQRTLLLRKIDCLKALQGFNFKSMDNVPLFYDTLKEDMNEERNAYIAREKMKEGKIYASDLAFVRLTQSFPTDGVVEHVGEYSEPEYMISPFEEDLLEKNPDIDLDKYKILIPRHRWTTHWCINGAVGDHTYGSFSGRNYVIIEEANQRIDDANIISDCVADTMMLGDTKISQDAKIAMTVEKYKELLNNPQNKQQLENMNIVLFNGSQDDCVKLFLNDTKRVWGTMSSYSYSKSNIYGTRNNDEINMSNDEVVENYLTLIENSLKDGKVEGFEHCHYASEGFSLKEIEPSNELLRKKLIDTAKATSKLVGLEESYNEDEINVRNSSDSVDTFYTIRSLIQYIDFLDKKFPEKNISQKLKCVTEEYWNGDSSKFNSYQSALKDVVNSFGDTNDLLMATEEYNKLVLNQTKIARKEKNKELLSEGLITPEQYNSRQNNQHIDEQVQTIEEL